MDASRRTKHGALLDSELLAEVYLSMILDKELKFSQTALLRIRDNKIISTYEGNEQIAGKLGRMTK